MLIMIKSEKKLSISKNFKDHTYYNEMYYVYPSI